MNHHEDLLTSSSNDTYPVGLTLEKATSRRNSMRLLYTVEELYGSMDLEEIEIHRMATRITIKSELASRQQIINDMDAGLVENNGEDFERLDPELIVFSGFDDPADPRNWPTRTKTLAVVIASMYTLITPVLSSIISPALSDIGADFHISSPSVLAMTVSIQVLAWAFGPLVIAPLSEEDRLGRKLVLDGSIWMLLVFNVGCAFSKTTPQLMVCRFLSGIFGSTPLNVAPAVVSDLFDAKTRIYSLAGLFLLPLLGPVLAPIAGGYIVEYTHWRWTLYSLCIFNAVVAVVGTIFFRETYAPRILKQHANHLRTTTQNPNLHTIYEVARGESTLEKLRITATRPLKLLLTHPLVIGLGGFFAIAYAIMYLMIVTFQEIFGTVYGFSKGTTGLMYLPMGIGFVVGVIFWTIVLQKVYTHLTAKNGGVAKPEFRVPCIIINTAVFIPASLLWYGWLVEYRLHWLHPAAATCLFGFSFCCVFQALQAMLIDSIKFAASAVAAAAVFRSLCGFAFPLFASPMFAKLGYGWGNTVFAIVAFVIGLPFPIVLYKYGERIRITANEKMEAEQTARQQRALAR